MDKSAGEIMTKKLVTVRWDDSVRKSYQLMQERRIRHLPVCDAKGDVIGILSDRDLQRAMKPNSDLERSLGVEPEFDESFQAKDFMNWPVRAVARDVPVEEVTQRMLSEKVSAFVVMDHGRASGIVTTDDLLKLLLSLLKKEPDRLGLSLGHVLDHYSFGSGHWA